MTDDDSSDPASSPCTLQEVDPSYSGLPPAPGAVHALRRDMRMRPIGVGRAGDRSCGGVMNAGSPSVPDHPSQTHDIPMHAIVTPEGVPTRESEA
jgi:hypothetical protein